MQYLGKSVWIGTELIFRKRHDFARVTSRAEPNCEPPDPANTVTDRLNNLLKNGGDGYVLHLCPNKVYLIQAPIRFAHPNQEISTLGNPTGSERAVLSVSGPVSNGEGHTTAVDGTCSTCNGIKLRYVQIDGTRRGAPSTKGGGNIEFGGANSNQLIEYVRSYDPRGWTCLHIAEGPLSCHSVTVQNNDIGPCGSDDFQQWADGISVSCRDSVIKNNMIQGPTDGGIVLFGAPGTQVFNNTIWVLNHTLLGGINMVDYDPWQGDYTGTVVHDNTILGGFATDAPHNGTKGTNIDHAIIKIGIAIGPRTWFGDKYGSKTVRNGAVRNNKLSGAFTFGIAVTSSENFEVQSNVLSGNTSFVGSRGPLCKQTDSVPDPAPFIIDPHTIKSDKMQPDFQNINDGDSLTCVLPPNGGDFWPYGVNPSNSSAPFVQSPPSDPRSNSTSNPTTDPTPSSTAVSSTAQPPTSNNVAVAFGIIAALLVSAVAAWLIRRCVLSRTEKASLFRASRRSQYVNQL